MPWLMPSVLDPLRREAASSQQCLRKKTGEDRAGIGCSQTGEKWGKAACFSNYPAPAAPSWKIKLNLPKSHPDKVREVCRNNYA